LIWESGVSPEDLRGSEQSLVSSDDGDFLAIYDLRPTTKLGATLGIYTTLIVSVVLGTATLVFNKITSDLVIIPIETMISKVNKISENPLKAAQEEENEALAIHQFEMEERKLHRGKKKKK
jgi:hypothetical protein